MFSRRMGEQVSSERARTDAKTAVGGGGSFGNDAYQLSIGLFREGASAAFAKWAPIPARMRCHRRDNSSRSKKSIFRELDRPLETAPKTTRESTSTKCRFARIPSRVIRLKRLIRLSSSRMLMCLPAAMKRLAVHFNLGSKRRSSCTYIVHVAQRLFAFPIKANMLPFLFGQIVQGEPVLACNGRETAASATWR